MTTSPKPTKDEALNPQQINEVNESLWDELDEIKEKTGYNAYREENRGVVQWTLLGYLLNLKHRADDKSGGEVAQINNGKVWAIDHSAGRPILVLDKCSVIEAEDAEYVLSLIRNDTRPQPQADQPAELVALTDEQIEEARCNMMPNAWSGEIEAFESGVRFAESRHGITAKDQL